MFGRRGYQRFAIPGSPEGTLRVLRDAIVERVVRSQHQVIVLSRHAAVIGDAVTLEFGERRSALPVRVVSSQLLPVAGTVRHRISLANAGSTQTVDSDLDVATPSIAALATTIPIRLLNCSACGCLFECAVPVHVAQTGSLHLVLAGQERAEQIQVVRCDTIHGSSCYHVGAQFLWTCPPGCQSLRTLESHFPHDLSSSGVTNYPTEPEP